MRAAALVTGARLPFGTLTADPEPVTSPDGREVVRLTVQYHDGTTGPRMFGPGDDLPAVMPKPRTRICVRNGRLAIAR